jgi:hypothetical protein
MENESLDQRLLALARVRVYLDRQRTLGLVDASVRALESTLEKKIRESEEEFGKAEIDRRLGEFITLVQQEDANRKYDGDPVEHVSILEKDARAFSLEAADELKSKGTLESEGHSAKRVGIIVVHGVGEQKRFEHLDGEVRKIIFALREEAKSIEGTSVTVEIARANSAPFESAENTWQVGPGSTTRIILKGFGEQEINLHIHEVWWADVNESYSLAKQVRFWLWGLAVWRYPGKTGSSGAAARYAAPPIPVDEISSRLWIRLHLFGVTMVFTALGFSIGVISFLAKRLFDLELPKFLQLITNYVSGVKLYNQPRRLSKSIIPADANFLDNINAAPRYAIRRRMLRAIADVACNDYDDWFVLAHSLGSVVAFNGLMEPSWSWPGYFDEQDWNRLRTHNPPFAGPHAASWRPPSGPMVPDRPPWSGTEVAYRRRIFSKFRGMLTYGCPLEKFAAIWPARVPISRVAAFSDNVVWVNAFDPLDPVSGVLTSFSEQPARCCPAPINVGYATSPILLYGHLLYLTGAPSPTPNGSPDLVTAVARWITGRMPAPGQIDGTGRDNRIPSRQFGNGDTKFHIRRAAAKVSWCVLFLLLIALGGFVLPPFATAMGDLLAKTATHFTEFFKAG